MKTQFLILLVTHLLGWSLCHAAGIGFPSDAISHSPDGKWHVRCKSEQTSGGGDYLHTLILQGQRTATEVKVYAFGRSCEVLWSPDSTHIALTDWLGSNVSEILLLDVQKGTHPISLQDVTVTGTITNIIRSSELQGHCYWEALEWMPDGNLRFQVFGHTDENPSHEFAYEFSVNVGKQSLKLLKKDNGPDSKAEKVIWSRK